ncbi:unnamed protein product [Calypogeia fissa]
MATVSAVVQQLFLAQQHQHCIASSAAVNSKNYRRHSFWDPNSGVDVAPVGRRGGNGFLSSKDAATSPSSSWPCRIGPCIRTRFEAGSSSNSVEAALVSELEPPSSCSPPALVECLAVTGGYPLAGHVQVSGSKNSALAVLAGALCSEQEVQLWRIPDLEDIRSMIQVLKSMGVRVWRCCSSSGDGGIVVDASRITSAEPCPEAVRKLRAGFFVIGALIGRTGEAVVPLPGGCEIGARPIDLHVRGLQALGALVEIRQGNVYARASSGKRLVGGEFHFNYPSVGATETLMMAATLAEGRTVLSNVAQEPEVVDLAEFLISCGARIHGAGTRTMVITGVKKLHSTDYTIIPDRIEAGTFLIAAAITQSAISMSPVVPHHLTAVVGKLQHMGCGICQTSLDSLVISSNRIFRSSSIKTLPYPGFPTDLQPQFMALLTTCGGQAIVEETVFERRMQHVKELQKLGATVRVTNNVAVVRGKDEGSALHGVPVTATDLRAGAALVLAGMAAQGTTHVEGVSHIDRGYESFDKKLRGLGASVLRLPMPSC